MKYYSNFREWQNKALVGHYGQDPVKLFFAKALSSVLLTCSLVLGVFLVGFLFVDNASAPFSAKMWNTGIDGVLITIFSFAYFQVRKGEYSTARMMFVGSSVIAVIFSIFATGGFPKSEVSQTIIVVPVLVYLFYGMRAGTGIALLSPLLLVLQWGFVRVTGVEFPDISAYNDPLLKTFLPTLIVYVLLIVIVAGYEHRQAILHRELKAERKNLTRLAEHDGLTEVANSRVLYERLKEYEARENASDHKLAMLYLDLDDFKSVNDAHGHVVGDIVLKTVAQRLSDCARDCGFVARVGGDEFVVVLHDDVSHDMIGDVLAKLDKLFSIPIHCDGVICRIDASVGVALYPDEVGSPLDLIGRADQQMYAVKRVHTHQRLVAEKLSSAVDMPSSGLAQKV